jgi:hypothetical protein
VRPVDAGPLPRARELEALGYLHMAIQQNLDTGSPARSRSSPDVE